MLNQSEEKRFQQLAHDILNDPRYQVLHTYIQHGKVTTYTHCVNVARLAFYLNIKLHIHCDESQLVKSCLLHDYYLYDWHTHNDHLHGYHHPLIASYNARKDFMISQVEQSAIETHMWPLTFFSVPENKCGWLLTTADKLISAYETILKRT